MRDYFLVGCVAEADTVFFAYFGERLYLAPVRLALGPVNVIPQIQQMEIALFLVVLLQAENVFNQLRGVDTLKLFGGEGSRSRPDVWCPEFL